MAVSRFESEQYASQDFVESVGAILFKLSSQEICVLRLIESGEHVLPKGRRNCGEDRRDTALREVMEETGVPCRLIQVNMLSRRPPPASGSQHFEDEARYFFNVSEPFTLQLRRLGPTNIKLIWWYIAAVNEDQPIRMDLQEKETFAVEFYSYEDVLGKLTFQLDRDMVRKAVEILSNTYDNENTPTVHNGGHA